MERCHNMNSYLRKIAALMLIAAVVLTYLPCHATGAYAEDEIITEENQGGETPSEEPEEQKPENLYYDLKQGEPLYPEGGDGQIVDISFTIEEDGVYHLDNNIKGIMSGSYGLYRSGTEMIHDFKNFWGEKGVEYHFIYDIFEGDMRGSLTLTKDDTRVLTPDTRIKYDPDIYEKRSDKYYDLESFYFNPDESGFYCLYNSGDAEIYVQSVGTLKQGHDEEGRGGFQVGSSSNGLQFDCGYFRSDCFYKITTKTKANQKTLKKAKIYFVKGKIPASGSVHKVNKKAQASFTLTPETDGSYTLFYKNVLAGDVFSYVEAKDGLRKIYPSDYKYLIALTPAGDPYEYGELLSFDVKAGKKYIASSLLSVPARTRKKTQTVSVYFSPYGGNNKVRSVAIKPATDFKIIDRSEEWVRNADSSTGYDYYYEAPEFRNGDKLIVTTESGTKDTYVYDTERRSFTNEDNTYDIVPTSVSSKNKWVKGKTNKFTVKILGKSVKVPVKIVASPLESIKYTPKTKYTFMEYDDSFTAKADGKKYQKYDDELGNDGDKITLNYKDGHTETYERSEGSWFINTEDGSELPYSIHYNGKQAATHWKPEAKNYTTVSVLNKSVKVRVYVKKNPVKGCVSAKYVTVKAHKLKFKKDGCYSDPLLDESTTKHFLYISPKFFTGEKIVFTKENGSKLTYKYFLKDEGDIQVPAFKNAKSGHVITFNRLDAEYEMSGQYKKGWGTGKHSYKLSYMYLDISIPVTVVK